MESSQPNQVLFSHDHHYFSHFLKKSVTIPFVMLLIGLFIGYFILHQQGKTIKQINTITVIGNGSIEVPPNEIIVYPLIEISSPIEEKAVNDNKKITKQLKDDLLKLGILNESITVSTYVNKPYDYPKPTGGSISDLNISSMPATQTTTFTSVTNFTITLPFSMAEKFITFRENYSSENIDWGALNYSAKNNSQYENRAREQALIDGKNQAEKIAKINNAKIGKIISVKDLKNPTSPTGTQTYPGSYYPPQSKIFAQYGEKNVQITASYEIQYELATNFFSF